MNEKAENIPLLVGDIQIENEAIFSEYPAVIYFRASWCGPCLAMDDLYEMMSKDYSGQVVFISCDVDKAPETVKKFKILAVPTIIFLDKGKTVTRSKGISSEEALRENIRRLI